MRKFFSVLTLAFILPLAACLDAEMTLTFPDDDTAEGTMVMTATSEFYDMSIQSGEPFCEDGIEAELGDGRHSCTETFSGTIDEAINDPDIGEGLTIERRDGGLLFVSFDLKDMTADLTDATEETGGQEMVQMMAAAFEGHAITLNVGGGEIVETNGTVSEDGKTAQLAIPLDAVITGGDDLPPSFDVLVRPGT